jgi:5-formyltetrahydrofolate cyclo-ligase
MDKKAFRQLALKNLRAIPRSQARYRDYRLNSLLLNRIEQYGARSVMLYIPLDMEVNVMPLIGTLRRRGIEVLVPFMEGESFRLVQYRLPLRTKRFGVREPIFSRKYRKKRIDIAIVPIVGTDSMSRRIGFGKGMYDRFFAREGQRIAHVIFVQRAEQRSSNVITDVWDVRADEILTGCIR